ncbi:MAG: hypothetical protein ACWGQW_08120 [bacterium]
MNNNPPFATFANNTYTNWNSNPAANPPPLRQDPFVRQLLESRLYNEVNGIEKMLLDAYQKGMNDALGEQTQAMKEEAYESGYEDGYSEGYEDGRTEDD